MYKSIRLLVTIAAMAALLASCGFKKKKYDNPITKDTKQPDKVLFDKAINDIERSRYEVARLTLQTLINTYDTSEYLAKAKLAIADSWMREGGGHGLAQAEAEYKDFILFYPAMEEAAEAQHKVCDIHVKQMEKADRDSGHALRAEDECRQLMVQFPNSKFAPETAQRLREIQEVLAEKEYRNGNLYYIKGSYPAAANRFQGVANQYPLFSNADEALWKMGESYQKMGDRFEDQAAQSYTRVVKDYPLSLRVDEAKEKLAAMKRPVPEADPAALARMKYELENREKAGMFSRFWGVFRKSPDVRAAAKTGTPALTGLRPGVPASVPVAAGMAEGGATAAVSGDVTAGTVDEKNSQLDKQPDARQRPPAAGGTAAPAATPAPEAQQPALPQNHQAPPKKK